MRRVANLVVFGATLPVLFAIACGGSGKPPTTPTIASSSAAPEATLAVDPPPPSDPRAVRCGVDDRPRSVLSKRDDEGETRSFSRAKVAFDVAAPEAIAAARQAPRGPGGAPRFRPPPSPPAPPFIEAPFDPPPPPPPNNPPLHFSLGAVRLPTGAAASDDFVQALDVSLAAFSACEPLFTADDDGDQTIALALTSNGSPIESAPAGPRDLTPFGKCIVEHACGLHIGTLKAPPKVVFALVASKKVATVAPPPDSGPLATRSVLVQVSAGVSEATSSFPRTLKNVVSAAASACAPASLNLQNTHLTILFPFAARKTGPTGPLRTPVESDMVPPNVAACIVSKLSSFRATGPDKVSNPVRVKLIF